MMPLPARSRMTSISYSFQPSILSSTSTSPAGDSSSRHHDLVLGRVVRDAAARAAQRERGRSTTG